MGTTREFKDLEFAGRRPWSLHSWLCSGLPGSATASQIKPLRGGGAEAPCGNRAARLRQEGARRLERVFAGGLGGKKIHVRKRLHVLKDAIHEFLCGVIEGKGALLA